MTSATEKLQGTRTGDLSEYRRDFPILSTTMRGKPLVYLDNGATTQKPAVVIETVEKFYREHNSNIHRGVYSLSQEATDAYEWARRRIAQFINAAENEVVFTRGTTEAINLVAASWGRTNLRRGDEIILTALEHHSNIVPWQLIAEATGAVIQVIPVNDAGELRLDEYEKLLSPRTKMVAVGHVSNSLGTINDVERIIARAHAVGAVTLIDGAQWVAHHATDVKKLDCDFYAFSGHKLFGPTGVGVLFGKCALLETMPPYQGGGDMIESVSFKKTLYARPPARFEAGTPNISGAIGLAAAIEYVDSVGFDQIVPYETDLLAYATEKVSTVPGLRIIGTAQSKATVISFVLEDPAVPIIQVGMELDSDGVAVRTGHHCCQPVMDRMEVPGTSRISMAFYNTRADIDTAVASLQRIVREAGAGNAKKALTPALSQSTTRPGSLQAGRGGNAGSAALLGGAATHPHEGNGELPYPAATAGSVSAAGDALAEDFDVLDDREAKNEYVLEMGAKLPDTFGVLKKVTPRVVGCMSEVYLVARRKPGSSDTLEFIADADAPIVRGLISVLQALFSGQKAKEILAYDTEGFFRRIGLDSFISSQRRNGLAGMTQRLRQAANLIENG
jgi:cysteine desulfurase/selenocysteine lyase